MPCEALRPPGREAERVAIDPKNGTITIFVRDKPGADTKAARWLTDKGAPR